MKQSNNRLSGETKRYMLLRIIFSAGCVILNLFISTFLLKSYGSFSRELISYNIILRFFQPVGVFLALVLARKFAPKLTQALGLLMYFVSLVLLCVFGTASVDCTLCLRCSWDSRMRSTMALTPCRC